MNHLNSQHINSKRIFESLLELNPISSPVLHKWSNFVHRSHRDITSQFQINLQPNKKDPHSSTKKPTINQNQTFKNVYKFTNPNKRSCCRSVERAERVRDVVQERRGHGQRYRRRGEQRRWQVAPRRGAARGHRRQPHRSLPRGHVHLAMLRVR